MTNIKAEILRHYERIFCSHNQWLGDIYEFKEWTKTPLGGTPWHYGYKCSECGKVKKK